jgi:hypothetical protein
MKKLNTCFFAFIMLGFTLSSCGNGMENAAGKIAPDKLKIDLTSARNVKYENMADAEATTTIIANAIQAKEDQALVNNIHHNLMKAERKAEQLQLVDFFMSEKPVENGIMLFSIKSGQMDTKELSFQMFEESSFALVAANSLTIQNGNNYTALNVKDIPNGKYVIRLEDKEQKELLYRVEIKNEAATNSL